MRLKGPWDACEKGMMKKLAVAEHVLEYHYLINWWETAVLSHSKGQLLVMEALHIRMMPSEEHFKCCKALDSAWTTVMRRMAGGWLQPSPTFDFKSLLADIYK